MPTKPTTNRESGPARVRSPAAAPGETLRAAFGAFVGTPVHARPESLRWALKIVFVPLLLLVAVALALTGLVYGLAFVL